MPEFATDISDKIVLLRGLQRLGTGIQTYEMLKVSWPSGVEWYGVMATNEVASVAPYDDDGPIVVDTRIIPDSMPDWFLPIDIDASIGDEDVEVEMWDADGVISQLLLDNGEGVRSEVYYWFPQVELLLPMWKGHMRNEDESTEDTLKLKIVQGIRSSDYNVPSRAHYQQCTAVFGGLFATDEEAEAFGTDCPYSWNRGGAVGNNNPDTGLPWTFCDRNNTTSCTKRGVNPLFHLSHRTITTSIVNPQHGGPALTITSEQNETNLKEPVPVAMGTVRNNSMPVVAFSVPSIQEHGWFYALYEACEGPVGGLRDAYITVSGQTQAAVSPHYALARGTKGQSLVAPDLSRHGYSGTALIRHNFGWIDTRDANAGTSNNSPISRLGPGDASCSAIIDGLSNIRTYTDADTFVESGTDNRVWQIARILCDNRWGLGYDYDKIDIQSFIDAGVWCNETVVFTDIFGDEWFHVRGESHVLLTGKKVQQQIEDMCMAGRLTRPYLFNGKINIDPLKALTEDELAAAPLFTDEGEDRNVIRDEDGKSTLTISRKSDYELINRVECTFMDASNDWLETPLNPIEDVDAQLAAGAVEGDGTRKTRKINSKKYPLQGVTNKAQALKMGWALLDLGPHDEGGLKNNCSIKFTTWFSFTLDLHIDKVIQYSNSRLTKYGFTHFRIKKMSRKDDLTVELECQAYPIDYMNEFEGGPEGGGVGGSGLSLTVDAAGSLDVWGEYSYDGELNGKAKWNLDPIFIQNSGSRYEFRDMSVDPMYSLLYYTTDNPTDAWDGLWVTASHGTAPAPRVREGGLPPPRPERPAFQPVSYANGVITIG